MIVVNNLQHFRESVRHAKKAGAWESLKDKLRWLHSPREWQFRNVLKIYKDFAPASFEFSLHLNKPGQPFLYNGGILFYAGAESGVGAPQFSVTTSGRKDARYEIHT